MVDNLLINLCSFTVNNLATYLNIYVLISSYGYRLSSTS